VVSRDEHEVGERAILNAGHTIGHALERLSNYTLPHGEGVAIGLVAECRIAEGMKLAEPGLADRVAGLLVELGLPVAIDPHPAIRELLTAMSTDKKNRGGRVRMALPAAIGRMTATSGEWTVEVGEKELAG
jgi:3-dehydroquinate synthase